MDKLSLYDLIRRIRDEANATDTSEPGGEGYAEGCETVAGWIEDWAEKHIGGH